ncbi:MAG: GNAT family N-acetyltransferase, partial [Phycisphaerae bacterium]|nr:GNAT family N-acetyltransferase [Phycisphaerae bacterium]
RRPGHAPQKHLLLPQTRHGHDPQTGGMRRIRPAHSGKEIMADNGDILIPYPLEILTDRLALRSPAFSHAEPLCEAVVESFSELHPWMPWAQEEPSVEKTAENIRKAIDEFKAQTAIRIHVFDRKTGQIVGSSGYPRVDLAVPNVEIGYWIRTSRTRRGICRETVRALTRYAMETLRVQRVEIRCDNDNERSWRVAERVGFTLEGILRRNCLDCRGRPRNTRVYSMLPDEWATKQQ